MTRTSRSHSQLSSSTSFSTDRLKIWPKAIVCDSEESNFRGNITISNGCVVHPSVTILAVSGPIVIGENCLLEEYTTIIHDVGATAAAANAAADRAPPVLHIGANNVFEVGCMVQASSVGERNVFECRSSVAAGVRVSNGCLIGAGCQLTDERVLPENTVIFGTRNEQRVAIEKPKSQSQQMESLRKILPNYHHLIKPTFDPKKARGQVV